jgi:AcrR family transcriptional regulator
MSKLPSSQRLRAALEAMASDGVEPTALALCEKAGISRNALYRYHPDVLSELHDLQRRYRASDAPERKLQKLRRENEELRSQVAGLTALVDHYFSAWLETAALLKRREREISTFRKLVPPKVTPLRR